MGVKSEVCVIHKIICPIWMQPVNYDHIFGYLTYPT